MNALVKRAPSGVELAAWVDHAEQNLAGLPSSRGLDLLKLTKQGLWVFGAKKTELAPDDFVAVNPFSAELGYIAFSDQGELLGEHMASLASTPIRADQLGAVAGRGWQKQVSLTCQIVDGANSGKAVIYKASSVGGIDFAKRIIAEMMAKLKAGDGACVPILELQVDSYQHSNKSYGTIFTPEYAIVEWTNMDFDPIVDEEPEEVDAAPAEPPAAVKRTRAPRGSANGADTTAAAPAAPPPPAGQPEPGRRMRRT